MERVLFVCVLCVLICSVNCQDGLSIVFIMHEEDNPTYNETEVTCGSYENLTIMCRINNIPNIYGFSFMNFDRVNKTGFVEHLATMQSINNSIRGYRIPELFDPMANMTVAGEYSQKNPSLGIKVLVASLTCNDMLNYSCSLDYDEKTGDTTHEAKNSTVFKYLTVSDNVNEPTTVGLTTADAPVDNNTSTVHSASEAVAGAVALLLLLDLLLLP
ncbi:uncharacterized protein LOC127834630 [Dreissena polymorpha]|uniref:Uncharacterized protein n=1 Tax=Dreissena polymorpha TaxID=45954 RepID=A0A9D4GHJ8_DREPO|nr:uncharacterized protein LOC127834630 [Dreissena polymorpha]KAH3815518.1 hypothetical protein DPMN_144045 [Dreissena polymorpha]